MKSEINKINVKKRKTKRGGDIKMLKSIAKMVTGFVLVLAIAAGSGYVSYLITSDIIKQKTKETLNVPTVAASNKKLNISADDEKQEEDAVISFDYYIARLEGETLAVYAIADGREEFLYNEAIFVKDLSADDLKLLQEGVQLENSSELTSFIENFTS